MQQLQKQILDVLTNVSRFGQRRGITDGKGNVQHAGQRPRQECFSAAGRTGQQDVTLFDLNVRAAFPFTGQTLVVIVDGHGEHTLRRALANHILIKVLNDHSRRGNLGEERLRGATPTLLLVENRLAQLDALSTNVDVTGTFNEWSHIAVTLPAKRTKGVLLAGRCAAARAWIFLRGHTRLLIVRAVTAGRSKWLQSFLELSLLRTIVDRTTTPVRASNGFGPRLECFPKVRLRWGNSPWDGSSVSSKARANRGWVSNDLWNPIACPMDLGGQTMERFILRSFRSESGSSPGPIPHPAAAALG